MVESHSKEFDLDQFLLSPKILVELIAVKSKGFIPNELRCRVCK